MSFIQPFLSEEQIIGIATRATSQVERNIALYRQFYDGFQGVLLTKRQKEYLTDNDNLPNSFANLMPSVLQIIQDRLALEAQGRGISSTDVDNTAYADFCTQVWINSDLDKQQDVVHRDTLKDGAAGMLIEWVGDSTDGMPVLTAKPLWDTTTRTGVRFDFVPGADDVVRVASYAWDVPQFDSEGEVEDKWQRVNVYARQNGQVFKWRYKSQDNSEFIPLDPEEINNEIGQPVANPEILPISSIPIVFFENTEQKSEIEPIFRAQRLLNKAVGQFDSAADYHGFPALVFEEIDNATDEQGNETPIRMHPGLVLRGKNGMRIEGADLRAMWEGSYIKIVDMISQIKGYPTWLLNPADVSIPPSGIALQIAEGMLVSQVKAKQKALTPAWREVFSIAREWSNAMGQEQLDTEADIFLTWIDASTRNVVQDMAVEVQTAKNAGLPDEVIWSSVFNLTSEQIDDIKKANLTDLDYWLELTQIAQQGANSLLSAERIFEGLGLPQEIIDILITIPVAATEL